MTHVLLTGPTADRSADERLLALCHRMGIQRTARLPAALDADFGRRAAG